MARQRLWRVALLVGLVLSLSLACEVPAATTWTVCASGCTYTSIKAAIAASTTHNGDTLAIAAGTYTEAGITVDKSLILQGKGAVNTIVQAATTQGAASDRVFTIPYGITVTLRELSIRYGSARTYASGNVPYGGGLYNQGTLTLINSTISSNSAGFGGGLYNSGALTFISSTIRYNSTPNYGGGLYNSGALTLINSTVSANSATTGGGGLHNQGGTVALTNSTVSGNSIAYGGGGLHNQGGTAALTNSTVSGNSNSDGGGGLVNFGTLTLTNSLVANNPNGGDCFTYTFTTPITSHGYNLDSDGSCQLTAPTDQPSTDPLLGPLQNNGGPTSTQALLPGSPAIDAIPWGTNGCGTTLVSDQRWQARPHAVEGACDIGAYEVEVAGQALSGWVTGLTLQTVTCKDVTTGQVVTLNNSATWWDCEAAGVAITSGDEVIMSVQGPVEQGTTDVGGAVTGMAPSSGGCTNLTTGQQAPFQALFQGKRGATAVSCVAAGLVVHPGDSVQISVHGVAE